MMKKSHLGLVFGSFLLTSLAQADAGFYADINVGRADQDIDSRWRSYSNFLQDEFSGTESVDGSATSYGVRVGYLFMDYIGIELGYQNYGEADKSYTDDFGDRIRDRFEPSALTFGVKGRLPLGENFALIGRAGIADWDFDIKSSDSSEPGEDYSASRDDKDPYYAFGVEYSLNDKYYLGLEYHLLQMEWSESSSDDAGRYWIKTENDVTNIALSGGIRF